VAIKVWVASGYDSPVVTEVKGIRGGREWVAGEVERNLAYRPEDGTLSVRWSETDLPDSLRRKVVIVQG
jgi:hypothetical protein